MVEKVERRLQVYRQETEPLIAFYAQRQLLKEIDATQEEAAVFMRLCAVIGERDHA